MLEGGIPSADPVIRQISTAPLPTRVAFDASELEEWDSSLLAFARQVGEAAEAGGVRVDSSGLPPGARRLMDLAAAVPERADARRSRRRDRPLARLGQGALGFFDTSRGLIEFIGLTSLSFLRLLVGRAKVRGRDFWLFVQEAGADALPIVSLISFLIGVILAFIGALQLRQFGRGDHHVRASHRGGLPEPAHLLVNDQDPFQISLRRVVNELGSWRFLCLERFGNVVTVDNGVTG